MSYIVTPSTSVVLVTTIHTSSIVYLPPIQSIGRLITVRDNDGYASLQNSILLSTVRGASFTDGSETLSINQSFGFITLSIQPGGTYSVVNTFAFPAEDSAARIKTLTADTIQLTDPTTLAYNTLYSSNSELYFNNVMISDGSSSNLISTINGLLYASQNVPTTWVAVGLSSNQRLNTYANPEGSMLYSINSVNWGPVYINKGFYGGGQAVTYGNGLFVAVGNNNDSFLGLNGSNTGYIQWSHDGYYWNNSTSPVLGPSNVRTQTCYANGIYHAVGQSVGGGPNCILWSTDAKVWNSSQTTDIFPFNGLSYATGIVYGNGIWVCSGTSVNSSGVLLWSSDGVSWKNANGIVPWTGYIAYDVTYDGSKFIAVVEDGFNSSGATNVVFSIDGSNWSAGTNITGDFQNYVNYIAVASTSLFEPPGLPPGSPVPNLLLTCTKDSDVGIAYSYDGYTWNTDTSFLGVKATFYRPYYDGSKWWVGFDNDGLGPKMAYSVDGITWYTDNLTGAFPNGGYPVGFVAVAGSQNANQQYISTVKMLQSHFVTGALEASTINCDYANVRSSILMKKLDEPRWLAVGQTAYASNYTIQTSSDKKNWTPVDSGGFNGDTKVAYGVVCNGSNRFVATGYGTTPSTSIQTSTDGLVWSPVSSGGFIKNMSSIGYGVAYNGGSMWLAVGYGDSATSSIQTSTDGLVWTSALKGGFDTGPGYGITYSSARNKWVAVGSGSSASNSIQMSTDGLTWTSSIIGGFSNDGQSVGYGVAYNGTNLWVAVGNGGTFRYSIQTSVDGSNWYRATSGEFLNGIGRGVAHNGLNQWVAVGGDGSQYNPLNTILTSTDGNIWKNCVYGGFEAGPGYGVRWDGSSWVAYGKGSNNKKSILTSIDGLYWYPVTSGGFTSGNGGANYIKYNFQASYITIDSITTSTIITSTITINTVNADVVNIRSLYTSTISTGTLGADVSKIQSIYTSTISSGTMSADDSKIQALYTSTISSGTMSADDSKIQALYTSTISSGTFSADDSKIQALYTSSISSGTLGADVSKIQALYTSTISSGVLTANSANINNFYTTTISSGSITVDRFNASAAYTNTIFASSISTVNMYVQSNIYMNNTPDKSLWFAVGSGNGTATSTIQYSTDSSNWKPIQSGGFTNGGRDIAYDGYKFVAVGNDIDDYKSILTSLDGLNWTNAEITYNNRVFSLGSGIAYNGSNLWVAVGNTTSSDNRHSVQYSTDGLNWFSANNCGLLEGINIAYNGSNRWVAVGRSSSSSSPALSTIQTSTDGSNWSYAVRGGFSNSGNYRAYGIEYGNGIWVAVGDSSVDPTSTIQYSTDSSNWYASKSGGFSNNIGRGVAYSPVQNKWVAVGNGTSDVNDIQVSLDGSNWTNTTSGGFPGGIGYGVNWDGSSWFAYGTSTNNLLSTIQRSTDGYTWYPSQSGGFSVAYGGIYVLSLKEKYTITSIIPGILTTSTIKFPLNKCVIKGIEVTGLNASGTNLPLLWNSATNVVTQGVDPLAGGIVRGLVAGNGINLDGTNSGDVYTGTVTLNGFNYQSTIVAIGCNAGNSNQGLNSIAVGNYAGYNSQTSNSIAIGYNAGYLTLGSNQIAIGANSGYNRQETNTIAIGYQAGNDQQKNSAIAIGYNAGYVNQGTNSIAIGAETGLYNQSPNSIALNASGSAFSPANAGFFVNPVRSVTVPTTNTYPLYYNINTREVINYNGTITLNITISDTFYPPLGYNSAYIILCGGGGGGGGGFYQNEGGFQFASGGSGGSGYRTTTNIYLDSISHITISIGNGGAAGINGWNDGGGPFAYPGGNGQPTIATIYYKTTFNYPNFPFITSTIVNSGFGSGGTAAGSTGGAGGIYVGFGGTGYENGTNGSFNGGQISGGGPDGYGKGGSNGVSAQGGGLPPTKGAQGVAQIQWYV